MTSKEALDILNYECIRSNGTDDEFSKELNIIRKDLKVLELIKNNKIIFLRAIFNEKNSYCGQSNVEVERAKESKEELNKIKEWLENDLRRKP